MLLLQNPTHPMSMQSGQSSCWAAHQLRTVRSSPKALIERLLTHKVRVQVQERDMVIRNCCDVLFRPPRHSALSTVIRLQGTISARSKPRVIPGSMITKYMWGSDASCILIVDCRALTTKWSQFLSSHGNLPSLCVDAAQQFPIQQLETRRFSTILASTLSRFYWKTPMKQTLDSGCAAPNRRRSSQE